MADQRSDMSRRALLAGMGAAGGAVLLGSSLRADAAPLHGPTSNGALSTPGGSATIASAPEPNVSYQFRSMYDFAAADNWDAGRQWGGNGMYSPGLAERMLTTFECPPGAVLRDIEWYVFNSVPTAWGVATWRAGSGPTSASATGTIVAGSGITAHRIVIPSAASGPFPHGTRFVAYINTPTDGTVQVNGARLGLTLGTLNPVMFTNPQRVYDSRDHGALVGGTTRTITMPATVPAGAQAVLLTLSIFSTNGVGGLRAGAGGLIPTANAIRWARTGDQLTNSLTCNMSSARKIAILSAAGSGATHFTLDLIGYLV